MSATLGGQYKHVLNISEQHLKQYSDIQSHGLRCGTVGFLKDDWLDKHTLLTVIHSMRMKHLSAVSEKLWCWVRHGSIAVAQQCQILRAAMSWKWDEGDVCIILAWTFVVVFCTVLLCFFGQMMLVQKLWICCLMDWWPIDQNTVDSITQNGSSISMGWLMFMLATLHHGHHRTNLALSCLVNWSRTIAGHPECWRQWAMLDLIVRPHNPSIEPWHRTLNLEGSWRPGFLPETNHALTCEAKLNASFTCFRARLDNTKLIFLRTTSLQLS